MKVNAGMWIDHLKTVIVITFEGGEKQHEIRSHVETRLGRMDGVHNMVPFEALPAQAEGTPGQVWSALLKTYYAEIIEAVRDAQALLIFGPGEAKEELRGHLQRALLGERILGVEAAGPMTDTQIAAKVRDAFRLVPVQ